MEDDDGENGLVEQLQHDAQEATRWIVAVSVVNFDLTVGPVIECVYPSDALSMELQNSISNMVLPDSNVSELGDSIFTIRVSSLLIYGVVCFRQIADSSTERGFFQKSLVILSYLPFIPLWKSVVSVLAPIYFQHGSTSVFEAAARNWSVWPDPKTLSGNEHLPFLGQVFSVDVPLSMIWEGDNIIGTFTYLPLHDIFYSSLRHLWSLWEIVITGRPLLIISDTPTTASNIVLALVSLLPPSFAYLADYRPYFTLTDPDYPHYLTMCNYGRLSGCIIGATNQFFLESLEKFPNILRLDSDIPTLKVSHHLSTRADEAFIRSLQESADKNSALRTYFQALTCSVLLPFDPYFKPAPYVARTALVSPIFNPYLDQIRLAEFSLQVFLKGLFISKEKTQHIRPVIRKKSRIISFYKSLIQGPNFLPWFDSLRRTILQDLDGRTDAAILAVDIAEVMDGLRLPEVHAMIKEIKRRKKCPRSISRPALMKALERHYTTVDSVLVKMS
uniref:UDENN domain-containing protein n=1 Tax=Spongospora subterranea TaxID=70186 RepID=A0A0H5QIK7_9EUKA|eukprot:CRZ01910.1 hypothetical protein [Spongospora subterranea]